jgi:hypothetical protein
MRLKATRIKVTEAEGEGKNGAGDRAAVTATSATFDVSRLLWPPKLYGA